MNYQSTHKFQKGISLMEIMVSLTLGIILLLALASVYVTANKLDKERSLNEALDESARQIFERLQQDLNMAGYVDAFDISEKSIEAVTFKRGVGAADNLEARKHYNIIGNINRVDMQAIYGRVKGWESGHTKIAIRTPFFVVFEKEAVEGKDDELTVRYQVKTSSAANQGIKIGGEDTGGIIYSGLQETEDSKQSGIGTDCLGQKPEEKFVENIYKLNNGSFSCKGNGVGKYQPIVENVTELKFRYVITGYVAATNTNHEDDLSNVYSSQSGLYAREIVDFTKFNALKGNEDKDIYKDPTHQIPDNQGIGDDLPWAKVIGIETCIIVAGEPLKLSKNSSQMQDIAALQPKIPTCARDENTGIFLEDKNRLPEHGTRLYRRYVKTFSIPNLIYFPSEGDL